METPEQIAAELTLPERVFILTRGQTDPAGRGYKRLAERGLADSWGFTSQGKKVAAVVVTQWGERFGAEETQA